MTMDEYQQFVAARLAAGDDPNIIQNETEAAIEATAKDWALFGDGRWRTDTVCSMCGSWAAGVCPDKDKPERQIILRREYEAARTAV